MIWTVIFLLTLSAVLSSNTMVPSVTKVGDTAELYCLVRDDWWASTNTLTVTWYMGGQEIDPATDSRIEIRNINFTSSIGSCTFSDPPAGKGLNADETRECTISVLRITDVKADDYNVAINCTWIEDVEPRRREGYMTGSILNPADDNPVTTLSTTKNLNQIGSAECASTSEIFWYVSFHGGITHIDVNDTESEYPLRENWLPANFPQNSSRQKASLYESNIIADFRGFLKKEVTLRCGPLVRMKLHPSKLVRTVLPLKLGRRTWKPQCWRGMHGWLFLLYLSLFSSHYLLLQSVLECGLAKLLVSGPAFGITSE